MTYLLHIINNNMKKQYGMTETSYGFGNGGVVHLFPVLPKKLNIAP